ncbi:hypothetical protein TcBrA4_0106720 [Trypanosoma cruzi]|nr:hypothetical protein TcBrA4_0106720 [Trypanosoma cruzi]
MTCTFRVGQEVPVVVTFFVVGKAHLSEDTRQEKEKDTKVLLVTRSGISFFFFLMADSGAGASAKLAAKTCVDLADPQRTSLPFVLFELFMVSVFTFTYFLIRRQRRLFELRTQQRHERLSRVEMGFGVTVNGPD